MFRAIGRLFRAFVYLITGRIDEARKTLMLNPNVIQANYDEIITDKTGRLNTYKKAVGGLISQQEAKMEKLKAQSSEVQKYEQLKAGAAAKAKNIVTFIGNNPEGIRDNSEYQKCQAAYRDFSSTLEEKQKLITELEEDVKNLGTSISTHKTSINTLLREIDRLKGEKHEAVAEVISSKQEKEISDMLSGISEDKTAKDLQDLRDVRRQARAEARISREVAGVTAKQTEDEFLGAASNAAVDNEFENLVGLSKASNELLDTVIQATEKSNGAMRQ
jgi:phage shock protein A